MTSSRCQGELGERRRLGVGIEAPRRVVEQQHARLDEERASERDPVALAAREASPARADRSVVAVFELLDERVRLGSAGGLAHRLVARVRAPVGDVLAHREREEEVAVDGGRRRAPQRGEVDLIDRSPVDLDHAGIGGNESRYERQQRALPAPGGADHGERGSGLDLEVDAVEGDAGIRILDRGVEHRDRRGVRIERLRALRLGLARLPEDLSDAPGPRDRFLHHAPASRRSGRRARPASERT